MCREHTAPEEALGEWSAERAPCRAPRARGGRALACSARVRVRRSRCSRATRAPAPVPVAECRSLPVRRRPRPRQHRRHMCGEEVARSRCRARVRVWPRRARRASCAPANAQSSGSRRDLRTSGRGWTRGREPEREKNALRSRIDVQAVHTGLGLFVACGHARTHCQVQQVPVALAPLVEQRTQERGARLRVYTCSAR